MNPIIIATWGFAQHVVPIGGRLLESGAKAMDAAVATVCAIEEDPSVDSVGFGCIPTMDGEVQLDAACMDGETLKIGAVLALEGYKNPCKVARDLVWEYRNNVLCGRGAAEYASAHGHQKAILLTDAMRQKWEEAMARGQTLPVGHDTVCALALDSAGHLASVVSTSGLGYKHRGRIGDSPLVGSGFYADDEVGAAAATGVGEDIMKGCVCYGLIECLRAGLTPQAAVEKVVAQHVARMKRGGEQCGNFAMIALNNRGEYGGVGTGEDFTYSIYTQGQTQTFKPPIIPRN